MRPSSEGGSAGGVGFIALAADAGTVGGGGSGAFGVTAGAGGKSWGIGMVEGSNGLWIVGSPAGAAAADMAPSRTFR